MCALQSARAARKKPVTSPPCRAEVRRRAAARVYAIMDVQSWAWSRPMAYGKALLEARMKSRAIAPRLVIHAPARWVVLPLHVAHRDIAPPSSLNGIIMPLHGPSRVINTHTKVCRYLK